MAKGSAFERQFCKELSLWFSGGRSDGWFWRTAGSGARATNRRKKGKKTASSDGDIFATDIAGKPLMDLITWEAKRGYSNLTVQSMLDRPFGKEPPEESWETWIKKTEVAAKNADSFSWAIVHRRDRRLPIICFPVALQGALEKGGAFWLEPAPTMAVVYWEKRVLVVMPLHCFYRAVTADHVRKALGELEK